MTSFTRLALAVAAIGLAGPLAANANDGAPPVLANPDLDALTASSVIPSVRAGAGAAGGAGLKIDALGLAQDVTPNRDKASWRALKPAAAKLSSVDGARTSGPAAATDAASAAGSILGGGVGRSVSTASPGSAGTASAAASSPGFSAVGVLSRSVPGLSTSTSRSMSSFSR
jgi:hypothetical protein